MAEILVTGASGYLGRNLLKSLQSGGFCSKGLTSASNIDPNLIQISNYADESRLTAILKNTNTVIHCAGVAHRNIKNVSYEKSEYKKYNEDLTRDFAKICRSSGVKRFILISTIAVYGKLNTEQPITENEMFAPDNNYARSKIFAEMHVTNIFSGAGHDFVILRPAMVYGYRAPGNYSKLLKLLSIKLPLPLAGCQKSFRSFLYVENFTDIVMKVLETENLKSNVFNVADNEVISTFAFISGVAKANGMPFLSFPVPINLTRVLARIPKFKSAYNSLYNTMLVSTEHAKTQLNWEPRFDFTQSCKRIKNYLNNSG